MGPLKIGMGQPASLADHNLSNRIGAAGAESLAGVLATAHRWLTSTAAARAASRMRERQNAEAFSAYSLYCTDVVGCQCRHHPRTTAPASRPAEHQPDAAPPSISKA